MKMTSLNSYISFKAHYYKVEPNESQLTIMTDNKPYLGKEPYVVSDDFIYDSFEPMQKTGNLYASRVFAQYGKDINYHIKYPDTRKIDKKNGSNYVVNIKTLVQKANEFLRRLYNQPMVHTIKSGSASGKIMYVENSTLDDMALLEEKLEAIKEPTILVTNRFPSIPNNPNILGAIYTNNDTATFSHFATQLRNGFDICATVYDSKVISKLENLNGKKVQINIGDNSIDIQRANNLSQCKKYHKINVPKMKYCSHPLKTSEYSSDIIGAKAVNIARLEKMMQQGKINCIIPKSIALPNGFIENLLEGNADKFGRYQERNRADIEKLKRFMQINGINSNKIMVRSSFNGEDLPYYPAAGLYDSVQIQKDKLGEIDNSSLYRAIRQVALSKNKKSTVETNARYGIDNSEIKAGIVIQNKIDADYTFTLYSDDKKGNIKIDLYSKTYDNKDLVSPHSFTFNKKTGKLTYNSVQMPPKSVIFDENGNIVKYPVVQDDLSNNKEVLALVKKLCKNAMIIESEFKAPQDIEGGFKDNDVYLWQTRNIV